MKVFAAIALSGGLLLGGCAAVGGPGLGYKNGWVHYVEKPGGNVIGIGNVTAVTLDPQYVRFDTEQGTHVIPREHLVKVSPVGGTGQ
ncbi:MAG TPA: hypothetical protein VEA69_02155 [Tepidisphaeraceae bacterium]|nr:hypothetical protein [Tepidisphaeraceae bacterium]